MSAIRCYHCGAHTLREGDCASCGAKFDVEAARRIAAAQRTAAWIGRTRSLDRELAASLLDSITEYVTAASSRAIDAEAERAAAAAEPVVAAAPEPEPSPVRESRPGVTGPTPPARKSKPWPERKRSELWSRLGPAFAENLLFTLAAFLMVGGAVYFVTTAWTTMTGAARLLVVLGGLVAFGGVAFGGGRVLNRRGGLDEVERTLTVVAAMLVPIAAIVAGRLLAENIAVGVAGVGVVGYLGWFAVRAVARQQQVSFTIRLPQAVGLVSLFGVAAPWLAALDEWVGVALAGAVCAAGVRLANVAPRQVPRRPTFLFVAAALVAFSAVAVVAGVALEAPGSVLSRVAPAGVVLTAVAWMIGRFENERATLTGERIASGLVGVMALAITGCVLAVGVPRMLLVACGVTTWTIGVLAVRLDRSAFVWPALVLSCVTYFLLPAPVREFALEIRGWFAGKLGYAPERLPLSFYGVTFLPYTAALALFAEWLRRRGLEKFSDVSLRWLFSVTGLLVLLAVTAGRDARAPAIVLCAQGVMLTALGVVTRRARLVFGGVIGVYGGVAFGLAHASLPVPNAAGVLAALGLGAIGVVVALRRRGHDGAFATTATNAVIDATALAAAAGTVYVVLPTTIHFSESPWRDATCYGAFAGLVGLLVRAYRQPAAGLVAWILAGLATLAAVQGVHVRSQAVVFAALSFAPVLFGLVAWRPGVHRAGLVPESASRVLPASLAVFAIQVFAAPALIDAMLRWPRVSGAFLTALVLATVAVGAAMAWSRLRQIAVAFVVYVVVAVLFATAATGYEPAGFLGSVALGIAAVVLAVLAFGMHSVERLRQVVGPVRGGAAILALFGAMLVVLLRLEEGVGSIPVERAGEALVASLSLVVAGAVVGLAKSSFMRAASAATILVALPMTAVSVCDWYGVDAPWYPLAIGFVAVLLRAVPGRAGDLATACMLVLAMAFALPVGLPRLDGDGHMIAAFGLVAFVARFGLAQLPVLRSMLVVVAVTFALWFAVATPGWIGVQHCVSFAIGAAAVASLAHRVRWAGVEATGAGFVAWPVGLAGLVFGAVLGIVTLAGDSSYDEELRAPLALALFAWGVARGLHARGPWRIRWPLVTAVVAVFVYPFIGVWLPPGRIRPDVEVMMIALGLAALRHGGALGPYTLVGLGVLLTEGDVDHISTPWAATLAVGVACANVWRGRGAVHKSVASVGSLALALTWTGYALDVWDAAWSETLASLAAVSALVAVAWSSVATRARRATARAAALHAAIAAEFTVLAYVFADTVAGQGGIGSVSHAVVMIASALVVTTLNVLRGRAARIEWPIYTAVAATLVAYGFAVWRTTAFAAFDGFHLHVVLLFGAGLLLSSRTLPTFAARPLRWSGLVLAAPAVLIEGQPPSLAAALALFLGAIVYGYAGYMLRSRPLAWLSAALLNGAVFSLWWYRGVVDPAFYGVPAGLTLAIGAEFVRHASQRLALRAVGLTVLYGSIAVQVARVESPTHALAMFAAGLIAVAVGYLRRRNDFLLVGAAAVVLDVVAYLARHGLERDFVGAGLLVGSGVVVLVAAVSARKRRQP